MKDKRAIRKDLVLVGGGHSHAIALRMFGMKPIEGVRITLISEASQTPYSGMLPGYVAGFYSREECHINLRSLCQFANAQLIVDSAIGLDLENQRVLCANRPAIAFDVVSIDIGSTPRIPALSEHNIGAKPIAKFLNWWDQFAEVGAESIAIVGGGTGGVELALNMQRRLPHTTMHLFQRDPELMPRHSAWIRRHFRELLIKRNIQLHLNEAVRDVKDGSIRCESGLTIATDTIIWVTEATAANWIAQSGVKTDAAGFILVNDALQSVSHPNVFAAGDIATMINYSRPKAGVFAVRQGKPLAENLRAALGDRSLRSYRPQKNYLSLIGTGNRSAVASYGAIGFEWRLLWTIKDRIDQAFMNRFRQLPAMNSEPIADSEDHQSTAMRCLGCGAKVGSTTLDRVLRRIASPAAASIVVGLEAPDDAAVVQIPANQVLVQTIDYFPALINDPFLFGQISTNHSLSDLFAMGATPQSALAIATLPYAVESIQEETLYQLLSGSLKVLQQAEASLIGGHTIEGSTLAFGLACNGVADPNRLLRKSGMQPGNVLILTKAIGTGTLFAAAMRYKITARSIDRAIEAMLISNQDAATCFLNFGATACTDVTGFGLVGHLAEMIRASRVAVKLDLSAIPILEGARDSVRQGILSSLHPQNLRARRWIENEQTIASHPDFALLFDPQTSGGLLASVPADRAIACLDALHAAGYQESAIVGHVLPDLDSGITIVK